MTTRYPLISFPYMKVTTVMKVARSASLYSNALKEFVSISKNAVKLENLT